jgi:hypothetical protein
MIRRIFAGIVVDDLQRARVWYEHVHGRSADAAPMGGLVEWHLLDDGWLQVVDIKKVRDIQRNGEWGSAGSSSIALVVDNLDDQLAVLRTNEIPIGPIYTTPDLKTATVSDPFGNLITFVEETASKS